MAESTLLALPAQGPSRLAPSSRVDPPLAELRRRRAVALAPTVRAVDGGFRVSSSCREIRYLVTQPNGHRVCTCPDFARHEATAGFRCKHVLAVEMAVNGGLLPQGASRQGHGQAPAPIPESAKVFPAARLEEHRGQAGEDSVRLKLIKKTRGYSWEISVAERDSETAWSMLQKLEQQMKHALGDAAEG